MIKDKKEELKKLEKQIKHLQNVYKSTKNEDINNFLQVLENRYNRIKYGSKS